MKQKENKKWFIQGIKHGIPICLGYFAVAFTLGIAAKSKNISAFQSSLMSLLMIASAGEFAAMEVIASGSGYLEMAVTTLIVNLRYLLMSCALSQKFSEKTNPIHRFGVSFFITDEIFGMSSVVEGELNPFYNYGAAFIAVPGWVLGTLLGSLVGYILPANVSSALGVALYCMFIAIVIPPARKNRVIALIVLASMLASSLFYYLDYAKVLSVSGGMRIIILTIVIAAVAAFVCPVKEGGDAVE